MSEETSLPNHTEFSEVQEKHPKGLYVLFSTEMWERFNFYGMRAILTLFLVNALRFSDADASIIYGGYLGLCYLTPMLGGFISDKYLGNRNCILLGGFIMSVGQFFMFASSATFASNFDLAKILTWLGLLILIIGNGFFKPNISSLVGQLYKKGSSRLDAAFTIFYMGINVGSFIGNGICSYVGDVKVGDIRNVMAFKWGFLAAAIAMLIGTVSFYFLKNKYILSPDGAPVGIKPKKTIGDADEVEAKFTTKAMLTWSVIFLLLVLAFKFAVGQNWLYAVIYSSALGLGGFILTDTSLVKEEKDRIWVLYFVAFFVVFFWACFEQAGSSLTFIADYQTDTHILGWQMPPSMVQNFNALFIVLFAFPVSILWLRLQKRNIEPISPVKQAMGLAFLALGYFFIAMRVKSLDLHDKMGVGWLVLLYAMLTIGELCLSPIGLSLVAKLAPKRFASLLMGVWFLANAAGYALAGTLGALIPPTSDKFLDAKNKLNIDLNAILNKTFTPTAEQMGKLKELRIPTEYPTFAGFTIHNLNEFFMVFVILPGSAAILLFLLSGKLKKMMHGVR